MGLRCVRWRGGLGFPMRHPTGISPTRGRCWRASWETADRKEIGGIPEADHAILSSRGQKVTAWVVESAVSDSEVSCTLGDNAPVIGVPYEKRTVAKRNCQPMLVRVAVHDPRIAVGRTNDARFAIGPYHAKGMLEPCAVLVF